MTDRKVLLIGLDAACFRQLDPLLASGSLPNIRRLIDSGVSADLETTSPPWTPSAWPSVTTGSAPWTHGIYDFHHYPKKNDPQLVGTHDVRVPFVWEVLSAHGLSSIVVNVPVTHPVHEFDGSLVPGCLAPEQAACLVDGDPQPMAAIDEAYRIYDRGYDPQAERLADYERLIDSRVDAARRLDDAHDWSFMMVQFQHTDAVFHTDGEDPEAVSRVYERVDGAIGSLRDLAGEDCPVLLVSDHGMHRYDRVFYYNTWLRDNGYLETAPDAERHAWNERTFRAAVTETRADTDADGRGLSERILGAIVEASSRLGVTAQRAEQALSAVGLDERVGRLLPEEVLYDIVDAAEYVDRSQSAAYCRSPSSLGIRCNVVGRDSEGVVPPRSSNRSEPRSSSRFATSAAQLGNQCSNRCPIDTRPTVRRSRTSAVRPTSCCDRPGWPGRCRTSSGSERSARPRSSTTCIRDCSSLPGRASTRSPRPPRASSM